MYEPMTSLVLIEVGSGFSVMSCQSIKFMNELVRNLNFVGPCSQGCKSCKDIDGCRYVPKSWRQFVRRLAKQSVGEKDSKHDSLLVGKDGPFHRSTGSFNKETMAVCFTFRKMVVTVQWSYKDDGSVYWCYR